MEAATVDVDNQRAVPVGELTLLEPLPEIVIVANVPSNADMEFGPQAAATSR
jgi:hypothetical protein